MNFDDIRCLDLSLAEKLEAWAAQEISETPELAKIYPEFVDRLIAANSGSDAPQKGDSIADFVLPDSSGQLVASSTLLKNGPLVISFNRGPWCSFCKLEMISLSEIHSEIKMSGGEVVAITPETAASMNTFGRQYDITYPMLSDIDNGYALVSGLMISLSAPIREIYNKLGFNLPKTQGNCAWFVPIPATFIVGTDGKIFDRLVDPDFRHRMSPDSILETLKQIRN